jgi:hypothetical protein
METSESDIGYPEEQPPEVDDTPAEGTPQRQGGGAGEGGGSGRGDRRTGNDDGKATGNPTDDDA